MRHGKELSRFPGLLKNMEVTNMQIVDSVKIFVGKPNSEFAKTCFPYVVQLSNGDLIASFQAASVKNEIDSKGAKYARRSRTIIFRPILRII